MFRLITRVVVPVLLFAHFVVLNAHGQAVERLMREIQSRHYYLGQWRAGLHGPVPEDGSRPAGAPVVNPIVWPNCCDESSPIFPNDGFYAVPMQDPAEAVVITRAIVAGLHS